MLAAAAKRMRLLQTEIELLDEWLDKGTNVAHTSHSAASASDGSSTTCSGNKDKGSTSLSASAQQSSVPQVFVMKLPISLHMAAKKFGQSE